MDALERVDAASRVYFAGRDLAVLTIGALFVRLAYLFVVRPVIDTADAIHYVTMAQQFAAGEFLRFDENLPVLYSALGALVHLAVPNWEWAFWVVSLAASTLTVVPVYLLARELHGVPSARLAATCVCVWPWLVDYATRIGPESLATFLWLLGAWLLFMAVERGRWFVVGAAVTFFALHLTRPEGTFLLLAAPICAIVLAYQRGSIAMRRAAILSGLCIASLGLYAIAMRYAVGTYTVSYRAPMSGDLLDYLSRGALEGARTFTRLFSDVLPVMLGPVLLVFLGVGMYRDWPLRAPRIVGVLAILCAVQWGLTVLNFSPAPRYIMPVVIVLSMWSARGAVAAGERIATSRPRFGLAPAGVVIASLLVGLAATVLPEILGNQPRLPREYKLAGAWMRENLEPGYVICRKPQVGFYAGMPTTGPAAEDTPADVIARAREIGARYLVIDERYTAQLAPGLKPLLDPANAPGELKLHRADISPYPGAAIVVYEFSGPDFVYAKVEDIEATTSHMGPDQRRRAAPSL